MTILRKGRLMNSTFVSALFGTRKGRQHIARPVRSADRCGFIATSGSAAAVLIGLASPASAQAIPTTFDEIASPWNALEVFEPSPSRDLTDEDSREQLAPEDTPVKTRQQPGYEPVGIRYGSWMFNPALISGALYDSNVFASNTLKRADIASVVEPTLRAHTLWERHGIDIKLDVQQMNYRENSSLDQTSASLKGNAWFDIAHDMAILTSFQIAHLNEGVGSLSSPTNAIAPTPYNLYSGDVTVRKEFNRLVTSVGVRTDSYDYQTTLAQNGSVINQDGRDGNIYAVHGRVDYAFSPIIGWFGSVEENRRDLRGTPTQSISSQGYRALAGVTVDLNHVVVGEFGAGYVDQRFDDPTIGTVAGASYRAKVTWHATRLLDIHFKAEQLVTETSDTSSTGVLANALQVGLDYEFRRNVILSLIGGYEADSFYGQPRKDHVVTTEARIKYLLNRYGAVSVFHRYSARDSDIPIFSYDKNQVGINVTAQF
jgi:hypothetical protein